MKELELRDLQPFDIMLSGRNTPLSQAIQHIIEEDISHTAVFFRVDNIWYVHESDRGGLRNANFVDYYYNNPEYNLYIARPKIELVGCREVFDLKHLAISTAGHKGYDYVNLIFHQPIKFIAKKLFKKEIWWGKRKQKADKRFICSERSAWIMNHFFGIENDWHKISTEHFKHSDNYELFKIKRKE